MTLIKKFTDFFLNTYVFIASAGACMVLATYLQLGAVHIPVAVTVFVFFSTMLIYNFHKVSDSFGHPVFSIQYILRQLKKIPRSTGLLVIISTIGLLISALFIHIKTLLMFLPLGIITYAYAIPLLQVKQKRKRLREIFLAKISTLALVWAFSTVMVPLYDSGHNPFSSSSLIIFAERFLFVFAICVPFEIRDMEQERKWGNTTLPLLLGETLSKLIGCAALMIFSLLVYREQLPVQVALPLYISALVAILLILFSTRQRSQYYFRVYVDGTMQLQFLVLLLFKLFS